MTEENRSYYEWCLDSDIISRVKQLLINQGYFLRDSDGKISVTRHIAWDTPWHHVYSHPDLNCGLWHKIMFDEIAMKLPNGPFVPSMCQNCYKVVVRPKTLKQLFALLELQKRLNRPAKCGIETRMSVFGLYGGYFYNLGIDEGKSRYTEVRQAVNENKYLGPDVDVILKRGCTEYEHAVGPSDEWKITEEQKAIEQLVLRWFEADNTQYKQSDAAIAYVHRKWIEHAWSWGDETVLEFTGGKPLYTPYITYHMT